MNIKKILFFAMSFASLNNFEVKAIFGIHVDRPHVFRRHHWHHTHRPWLRWTWWSDPYYWDYPMRGYVWSGDAWLYDSTYAECMSQAYRKYRDMGYRRHEAREIAFDECYGNYYVK